MSKIGYLKPVNNGNQDELHGELTTLQMQLKIKLIPNSTTLSDNAPDFVIASIGHSNVDIPIGAAWKKQKQKIGDVLIEFLSLTIDDPSFPTALNVAAFKQNDGTYEIVWRRRQQVQTPEDTQNAA